MKTILNIAKRFCGPENSGNGGYVSGLLASVLLQHGRRDCAVEVRLKSPPPLEQDMAVSIQGEQAALLSNDVIVAQAHIADLDLGVPALPSRKDLEQARGFEFACDEHFLPACFVCGPARNQGDGLRIFSAPIEGADSPCVAAFWTPDESLGSMGEPLSDPFVWAALDCPGYSAHQIKYLMLLGTMTAQIYHRPIIGHEYILIAKQLSVSGRKYESRTALMGNTGKCYAQSKQVWIKLENEE